LARFLSTPNLIAIHQTLYEKRVTVYLHLHYFGAPGVPPGPKFANLGGDVYVVAPRPHMRSPYKAVARGENY